MPTLTGSAPVRPRVAAAWCAVAVVAASVLVVAASADRSSSWREHEIRVDGQDDDWRGLPTPVKGARFSLGIVNDGEFLYFCLPTKDLPTRSQIARQGLVLWLDKQGGKKENFGIHFPMGMATNKRNTPAGNPNEPADQAPAGQDAVGILKRGGRDAEIVPLQEAGGIEARVGVHDDLLVYELKVPLKVSSDHPFAPNLAPGDVLRLGIETASFRGPVAPLGVPAGGVIVGGGRGGWGVSVGGPGGMPRFENPIRTVMTVKLAAGPS